VAGNVDKSVNWAEKVKKSGAAVGDRKNDENQASGASEPIFMVPGAVTALVGLVVAIHIAQSFLDPFGKAQLTYWFGFIPLRLVASETVTDWLPLLWTPFTHAFLHAGWEHLIINAAWLAIFGTPVARRYGTAATLVLFLASAVAGAAAFTATSLYAGAFLVGASGGVSGLTGAAVRFIFQPVLMARDPETGRPVGLGRRLASWRELLRNPRSRWFTLFWVGLNAAIPLLSGLSGASGQLIAWQAHLGGFAAGLLLVQLFERRS
jgi:membrane associated rhomboid family serine protease